MLPPSHRAEHDNLRRSEYHHEMDDVTKILRDIELDNANATDRLLPIVYAELRKLAADKMRQERTDDSLGATGLVHEVYLRLVASGNRDQWKGRGHFFGAAAEAMRRILIDRAREKKRIKRGGKTRPVDLDSIEVALDTPDEEILALDAALCEFADQFPESAELIKLRFFGGLSLSEAASVLEIPARTADRKWAFARAWLHRHLQNH